MDGKGDGELHNQVKEKPECIGIVTQAGGGSLGGNDVRQRRPPKGKAGTSMPLKALGRVWGIDAISVTAEPLLTPGRGLSRAVRIARAANVRPGFLISTRKLRA